jgi:hypothetical protein
MPAKGACLVQPELQSHPPRISRMEKLTLAVLATTVPATLLIRHRSGLRFATMQPIDTNDEGHQELGMRLSFQRCRLP